MLSFLSFCCNVWQSNWSVSSFLLDVSVCRWELQKRHVWRCRAAALHLCEVGGFSLTRRCNKAGFHGDSRGWHGDGVVDPQIKHDNEPCLFLLLSDTVSNSLKDNKKKTEELDKCLKDVYQQTASRRSSSFFAFLPTCLTGRLKEDSWGYCGSVNMM